MIREQLGTLGSFELYSEAEHTIDEALDGVKMSFFGYRYPLLRVQQSRHLLRVASMLDIALMKLEAISGRGTRKDFIDLHFILERFTLQKLFQQYPRKYGIEVKNNYHLLKSLVYFNDAEKEPMPLMLKPLVWGDVKKRIVSAVRATKL